MISTMVLIQRKYCSPDISEFSFFFIRVLDQFKVRKTYCVSVIFIIENVCKAH